jgi:hypothetical protein
MFFSPQRLTGSGISPTMVLSYRLTRGSGGHYVTYFASWEQVPGFVGLYKAGDAMGKY